MSAETYTREEVLEMLFVAIGVGGSSFIAYLAGKSVEAEEAVIEMVETNAKIKRKAEAESPGEPLFGHRASASIIAWFESGRHIRAAESAAKNN